MTRPHLLLIATVILAGTLSCRQPNPERDATADKQDVARVGEREISALSAGDIDGNLSVMTQDVVLMPPNEPMLNVREAMRTWLQRVHEQFKFDLRYSESHVDVVGDWAIQRYVVVGNLTPKTGAAPIEERGKGIHIYRRQPDGNWLIAQDIWNSDLPASDQP